VEHKRKSYHRGHKLSAGEFDLGNCISCERTASQVTKCTCNGNKYRIKDISGERDPGCLKCFEHHGEVRERRVNYVELRGIHPKLIKGFERLDDCVIHRQEHEYAKYNKEKCDTKVAARGTVKNDLVTSNS
jgi:hypothetical protein